MRKLAFLLCFLPVFSFGQVAPYTKCVDSLYAQYLRNLRVTPTPSQAAQMLASAQSYCSCMSTYIGDTTSGGGSLTWSDTSLVPGLASKYYVLTHGGGGTVDSFTYSTRAWRNKAIDSILGIGYIKSISGLTDSFGLSTRAWRQKGVDSIVGIGYITSISGLTDTFGISTRKWRQKGIDSVSSLFSGYFPITDSSSQFGTSNNLVSRDGNGNTHANNFESAIYTVTATAGITTLNAASARIQLLIGSTTQTYQMPSATTLHIGHTWEFNNNTTNSNLYVTDATGGAICTVPKGGYAVVILTYNYTTAGTWDKHFLMPSNASYGTNGMTVTGTFSVTSTIGASNLSGTNTGDQTAGYGISSANPITVDSSKLATLATTRRIADSAAASVSTGGTVTSVGLSGSGIVSVSGSPVTTSGVMTITATAIQSVTATAPITVATTSTAMTVGIPQASGSANGYLSSTDWTTFNNKGAGSVTSVNATVTSGAASDITFSVSSPTTTPSFSLNVPTASGTQRGALSSTDWTTFNNKGSGTVTSASITLNTAVTGGMSAYMNTPTTTPQTSLNIPANVDSSEIVITMYPGISTTATFYAATNQTIARWMISGDASGSVTVAMTDNGSNMIGGSGNAPILSSAQQAAAALSSWSSNTVTNNHKYVVTLSGASLSLIHI